MPDRMQALTDAAQLVMKARGEVVYVNNPVHAKLARISDYLQAQQAEILAACE